MENEAFDKQEALIQQKQLLTKKKERLEKLILLIEDSLKGENYMNFEAFDQSDIEKSKKEYAAEVKERWGNTKEYQESEKKTASYDKDTWAKIDEEGKQIFRDFAACKENSADSNEAQELVKRWQDYITKNYYTCTKEILSCLGMMYVQDERFQKNLDAFGEEQQILCPKRLRFIAETYNRNHRF